VIISLFTILVLVLGGCGGQKTKPKKEIQLKNEKIEQDLGYAIGYPEDWDYKKFPNNAVVIKGKEGTPAAMAIIQIQSYPNKADGGPYENVADVIVQFKKKVSQKKVKFVSEKEYIYKMEDGTELKGIQVVVNMTEIGIFQKQIILPSANGKMIHQWSYSSSVALYRSNLYIADAVLGSWKIF
jgi:hypothetical protein